MGLKAAEALTITYAEMDNYLRANHSVYMEYGEKLYYLTDANDIYWRAQDTTVLNEKGHYTDCSILVPTVSEFLGLQIVDGKTIEQLFDDATFYASEKK